LGFFAFSYLVAVDFKRLAPHKKSEKQLRGQLVVKRGFLLLFLIIITAENDSIDYVPRR